MHEHLGKTGAAPSATSGATRWGGGRALRFHHHRATPQVDEQDFHSGAVSQVPHDHEEYLGYRVAPGHSLREKHFCYFSGRPCTYL